MKYNWMVDRDYTQDKELEKALEREKKASILNFIACEMKAEEKQIEIAEEINKPIDKEIEKLMAEMESLDNTDHNEYLRGWLGINRRLMELMNSKRFV